MIVLETFTIFKDNKRLHRRDKTAKIHWAIPTGLGIKAQHGPCQVGRVVPCLGLLTTVPCLSGTPHLTPL